MANDNLRELAASASEAVQKSGLEGLEAEVVLILDVSRSMFPIYRARIVHDLIPQLLGLALNFDDDGTIPSYAFGDTARHLRDLKRADFHGWVDREVIRTGNDYQQGSRYAPVINEVCRYFFPEDWDRPALKETVGRLFKQERVVYPMLSAPRAYPVFAIFVTGGDCQDEEAAADVIRRSSRLPIFWQFIGLSSPGRLTPFRFLKRLDKLGNTYVDNAGFFEPGDVRNASTLYRGLLNELPDYIKRPEVRGMLRSQAQGGLNTRGYRPDLRDENEELDALTTFPPEPEEVYDEPEPEPEPEPERDMTALREKFAGIEWVEGSMGGGGGAVRAAAPVKVREEVEKTPSSRRRMRPSELEEAPVAQKDDSRQRVADGLARLKSTLATTTSTSRSSSQDDAYDAPDPTPSRLSVPSPPPRPSPVARPSPPARPTPAPPAQVVAEPEYDPEDDPDEPYDEPYDEPDEPDLPPARPAAPSHLDALRARLAAFGDDDATVAASGYEVDQEGAPLRPQPPPRPQPPARPQPPPRKR